MEELKTLKDLIIWHIVEPVDKELINVNNIVVTDWNQKIIQPEDLKAEAVKRAKYFLEMMELSEKEGTMNGDFNYFKGRFDEVMEMNNLTEEDLK